MKFANKHNETFFNNIIRHDLTQHEWKVILTFITDSPEFNISLKEIERRTEIAQPNISRALKGLVHQNILFKIENKYELNKDLLAKGYDPQIISTTELRREIEAAHNRGNGNFHKQAKIKKEKYEAVVDDVRQMTRSSQEMRKYKNWESYTSAIQQQEIYFNVEEKSHGAVIKFCTRPPWKGIPSIAPMDIAEEICRTILKIDDPQKILRFIDWRDRDKFITKYNLKKSS